MKCIGKYGLVFAIVGLFISSTWAAVDFLGSEDSYWQCMAADSLGKQWLTKHPYQRAAINYALAICKKESQSPGSCKVSKHSCQAILSGLTTRSLFRCTAFDQKAVAWFGDIYTRPDEAAMGAKAYCKERSSLPDTCYVNVLTCKNLNEL